MTLEEALAHFNSAYDLAKQLGIAHQNLARWKKQDFIPVKQQIRINQVTGINMPIDLDKESMLDRVSNEN